MLSTRPLALHGDGPSQHAYARTPAKGLLKNRGTLQENALHRGSLTVNGKGKAVLLRTPQNPTTARKKGLHTAKPTIVVSKPLGDKTPFPNRQAQALQTPAPQAAKLAKLSLFDESLAKTPGNLLLPSARRKNMRLPRSASKKFQTPDVQGNHWDVSDGEVQVDISEDIEDADVEEPDYDEIEYMPPKVPEQPFEPLFDLPDYKAVGKTLLDLEYSGPYDDSAERFYSADIETVIDIAKLLEESGGSSEYRLDLPDLSDDDPFSRSLSPPPRTSSRTSSIRSDSRQASRKPAQGSTTSRISQPSSRLTPPVTRSSSRIASLAPQNTTSTRTTRSTAANTTSTQPIAVRNTIATRSTAAAQRPVTSIGTRSTTTRKTAAAPIRPTSGTGSRVTPAAPGRATVDVSRSRAAPISRTVSTTRASSRAESVKSTNSASAQDDSDLLQFELDDALLQDDFQFKV